MKTKNKIIKLISFLIVISILAPAILFSAPKKAEAWIPDFLNAVLKSIGNISEGTTAVGTTTNTSLTVKSFAMEIIRQMVMAVEKKLLQEMTKSTINWINSGFHGNPLYIQSDSIFKDIAKTEVKNMVDIFGYDPNRFPFGKDFALNIINSYKSQLETNAQYTLSNVITDPVLLKSYRNDFNTGGWDAFLINTQYPQNNPVGFQMLVTEKLAEKVNGYAENKVQQVQTALQQGQGFLSPKKCETNPAYNNGTNEFNPPRYNQTAFNAANPPPSCDPTLPDCVAENQEYYANYDILLAKDKSAWGIENGCVKSDGTSGLVATTPGSVVASQITNAMGSTMRQSELGAALGSSLSSILDALMNKFIGSGLSALTTTTNSTPKDNWSYNGQTLGSPSDILGTGSAWDSGPDHEIILSNVKKQISGADIGICSNLKDSSGNKLPDQKDILETQCKAQSTNGVALGTCSDVKDANGTILVDETNVMETQCAAEKGTWKKTRNGIVNNAVWTKTSHVQGDIDNTKAELKLIYNEDPNDPGITQMFGNIWPKTLELDRCIPGPDLGWQARVTAEKERQTPLLYEKAADEDPKKSAAATTVLNELTYASKMFIDWINNKMLVALPKSVIFMDAVDELGTLDQESSEITDARRLKTQGLARLEAIKSTLDTIQEQPKPGSGDEKILIKLQQQYEDIRDSISLPANITSRQNQLEVLKNKYKKIVDLIPECTKERTAAGWTNVDWANVRPAKTTSYLDKGTEENVFCDFPIKGGYTHDMFKGPDTTIPKLPMLNAKDVMNWTTVWGDVKSALCFGFCGGATVVDIGLNCDAIYNASLLNYKQNLPGVTPINEQAMEMSFDPSSLSGGSGGQCTRPTDAGKHSNPGVEGAVALAKSQLGVTTLNNDGSPAYECSRFQIVKLAAKILAGQGSQVGLWKKPTGNNCEGYSVDIMAFPDGYIYDVLGGGGDGANPYWGAATCLPLTPEKYTPANMVP